jgi:GAF domain-containing protein/HAMP domain-containing protein
MATALRPMPLLAGLTAAGLGAIYLMGLIGVLDPLGWQLLAMAILLVTVGLMHRAILDVAHAGKGLRAFALHAAVMTFSAVVLALLWESAAVLAILAAWIAPGITYPARLPRRPYYGSIAASALATALIIAVSIRPVLPRMASNTTAGFAALLLLAGMLLLFVMLVVATQAIRYRSMQSRLMGTLVPIIAVPILFTTAIAAFNSLTSSQQQFQDSLQAVSSLKRGQMDAITQAVFADLGSMQEGSQEAPSIMHVLQRIGASDDEYRLNASLAATQLRNIIVMHPTSDYDEVMILDKSGNAILSTYLLNQGNSFGEEEFFRQGLAQPTARFVRYPGRQNEAGEFRLVGAVPFYGNTAGEVLGVVVGVANPDAVLAILEPTVGLADVNTYLVNTELLAVTAGAAQPQAVEAPEIAAVVSNRGGSGSATYRNYAGIPVLGNYDWDPSLQVAVVSEVPQGIVVARSLAAVFASGLVGLITIVIAGAAVLAASRAITEPITNLAGTAQQLAAGELSARAASGRDDEVGRLAESFNTMAAQMQGSIASLEQRVAERTRALELQTLRLRTAAEVARDATQAPTLDELLGRAARLVLDRFNIEDVGIYLLDEKRQFAVLQAAPTELGQSMLAAGYRVPVGHPSAVGQAAETGEAQLALEGSTAGMRIGDEYHTATRSQLTLPLRTNEGTIGLLDLQSETAGLFTPADATTIQVLADQLAAAVERGRLLVQVQQRLDQLEQSYRRFTEDSWGAYGRTGGRPLGYRYDNVRLDPLTAIPDDVQQALAANSATTTDSGDGASSTTSKVHLPIRLRGQSLGVITLGFRGSRPPPRTIVMLEQAADRLGAALENVRLLEESLRRASKERLIGQITTRIGSSISVRNVLQTAAEELGRALPGTEVSINFSQQPRALDKENQS